MPATGVSRPDLPKTAVFPTILRALSHLVPLAVMSLLPGTAFAQAQFGQVLPRLATLNDPLPLVMVQIRVDIPRDCKVASASTGTPDPLSTAWQSLTIPSIGCNYSGSPTVRLWSSNGGELAPEGSMTFAVPAGIAYEVRLGGFTVGRPGTAIAPVSAVLPPLTPGQPRQTEIAIRFIDPASAVPGDYADTIYLEVIP